MMKCLKLLILIPLISLISHFSYANIPVFLPNRKIPDDVLDVKPLYDPWDFNNKNRSGFWNNDHQEIDCLAAAVSQPNMNQCSQRQAQYSTQQLNQLLTEIQQIFGNNHEQWLQLNQLNHKWERLREQICLWEKATFGVELVAPMIYHNCIIYYNNQYLESLKDLLYTVYQSRLDWNHPD
ncbi:MAG: DUF1311 domain-containing protein [Thioploca sp.]|nr:DUF1311 domain-containing protein [Thioploca sp.]